MEATNAELPAWGMKEGVLVANTERITKPDGLRVEDRYDTRAVGQFYDAGWWSDRHLCSYLDQWAAERGDDPFISDGVRSATYRQFREQSYNFARSLLRLGVRPGDRVVVQLPNWVEFASAYVALGRIGAVLVPMMPVYRFDEAEYVVDHSAAVVALTCGVFHKFDHRQMFHDLRRACPSLRAVIVARNGSTPDDLDFDDLAAPVAGLGGDDQLTHTPDPDDVHLVVYTSGTESKPKGCCHTWNTFGFSARGLARDIFKMGDDDNVFMPSPVAHSTGLLVGIAVPLVAGAQIHLLDVWDPKTALDRIEQHRCTVTATATPFLRMTLDAYNASTFDMSSMRAWLCAGAPIPPAMVEEASAAFTGCQLLPLYGCSEVLAATSCALDGPAAAIVSSDGRPALEGVEIRLADSQGESVGDGIDGEILYRGPGCMLGYWREPARTAATIDADSWYHSGDLARWVGDSYLRVTGRIKDLVIRGGTNISAREVEEHLDAHPKIRATAVVGYPDDRLGERACAFIVLASTEAPTLAELADYLRNERRIAVYKIPERLVIVDALPTGATGKVQKFQLRQIVASEGSAPPPPKNGFT
jgi:cyclohexanecarboxylate-CoA ligase/acyl-CoA synthetase